MALPTGSNSWTGDPTRYSYEWLSCTTIYLNSCTKLTTPDATDGDTSYTPTAGDIGHRLRSRVQAHNDAGDSRKKTSLYSKKVVAAT